MAADKAVQFWAQLVKPVSELAKVYPQLSTPSIGPWAQWLSLGVENLSSWRGQIRQHNRKSILPSPPAGEARGSDAALLHWAATNKVVLAPCVQLAAASEDIGGSTFVLNQTVPTGMYLMSIPRVAILELQPEAAGGSTPPVQAKDFGENELNEFEEQMKLYFGEVERMMELLLAAAVDPNSKFHGYAMYLRQSQAPPKNLPFLEEKELKSPVGIQLWKFAQKLIQNPMSPYLKTLSKEEYSWAMSMVLSRRNSGSILTPVADKLNHAWSPNMYYTLAEGGVRMTGLDVMDNMMAGVAEEDLFEPHMHVFTIEKVKQGQPLTISYSDARPSVPDERDSWLSNWGFIPATPPMLTGSGLRETGAMIARRRVLHREALFPPLKPVETTTTTTTPQQQPTPDKGNRKPLPPTTAEILAARLEAQKAAGIPEAPKKSW